MDLLVERDHVLDIIRGADVPRLARVIEKRRVATPAVRVAVSVGFLIEKKTPSFQVGGDLGIRNLEEFSGVLRYGVSESPEAVKRRDHCHSVLERSLVIVFAVRWRHMNDARSIAGRDEIPADKVPALLINWNEAEPPFVFSSDEIAARHGGDNFGTFRYDREALFRENQELVFEL